jgi:hypothetical protein
LNPKLEIFIHTWDVFSNNKSWREIEINNTPVTKEIIYNYFGNLNHLIKKIIIDCDTKIKLIGNLLGNINNGVTPIHGWKNYWYDKYKIIKYINDNKKYNENVINLRFDLLNNSNSYDEKMTLDFIKNHMAKQFTKNIFLFNKEINGIDNIYIGNIKTMYTLTHYFFYELDYILTNHCDTWNQEKFVYRINNILFLNKKWELNLIRNRILK